MIISIIDIYIYIYIYIYTYIGGYNTPIGESQKNNQPA